MSKVRRVSPGRKGVIGLIGLATKAWEHFEDDPSWRAFKVALFWTAICYLGALLVVAELLVGDAQA